MKQFLLFFLSTLSLAACGDSSNPQPGEEIDDQIARYQVIEDDLQILKDDFNANQGRIRLLFLSGPTCGICLRGMADLNDEFLAAAQQDDRLVTFVVHVPTMGAKEEHAAESIPLLEGPRIHHYWEASGIIGQHFTAVMDVNFYVWDFWAIYGPDARWDDRLPPEPAYYEHQLGVTSGRFRGFPGERVLDAERFGRKTHEYLETVDVARFAAQEFQDPVATNLLADGTEIAVVGQPRNVAVRQHIIGRGGYANLKRVRSMRASGTLRAGGSEFELIVTSARPDALRREIRMGDQTSLAESSDEKLVIGQSINRGLPTATEELLLQTFEFDGLFVEWPQKGHELAMAGMQKIGDILAWRLILNQQDGPTWNLYVDSHSGDLIRKELLVDAGSRLVIRQGDFRDVAGIRFPHRVEYLDNTGTVIATETFESIVVEMDGH